MKSPNDITVAKNVILGCHITGVYDVNRNEILARDDFSIVELWASSIKRLNLQAILFHNHFSEATIQKNESSNLVFVKVDYNKRFNPNVFRYFVYTEFLKAYSNGIKNLFFTDVGDVEVLKDPFAQSLFLEKNDFIFCGDEPTILSTGWMKEHGCHLREKIQDYAEIEEKFKSETLLNCGIVGGSQLRMQILLEQIWEIHATYNYDNKTAFTGDMGAFNYVIRKLYNEKVVHGSPVNSEFKAYHDNGTNWFMHK